MTNEEENSHDHLNRCKKYILQIRCTFLIKTLNKLDRVNVSPHNKGCI